MSDSDTQLRQLGAYQLIRQIGQGGSASVFLAHQAEGPDVAVKVFHPDASADLEFLKRLQREGGVGSLRHRNIIQIYDVGNADGSRYVAMEYHKGGNLQTLMASSRKPFWIQSVELATQVFEALEHSHRHGAIHRNLKPTNVLLNAAGEAIVTDFSLAPLRERVTTSGSLLTDPEYKAPEQFDSVDIDGRADIYTAFLLLYEMLTSVNPFRRKTMPEVVRAQLFTAATSPDTFNPDIPSGLNDLILKGLAKKPGERPAKAGEVAEQLRGYLRDSPPSSLPPDLQQQPPPPLAEPARESGSLSHDPEKAEKMSVMLIRFSFVSSSASGDQASGSQRELRDRLSYLLRRSPAEDLQWNTEGGTILFSQASDALRCARSIFSELETDRFSLKIAIITGPVFSDPAYAHRPSLGEFACKTTDMADRTVRDCQPGQLRLDKTTKLESDSRAAFQSLGENQDHVEIFSLLEESAESGEAAPAQLSSLKSQMESGFSMPSGSLPAATSFEALKNSPPVSRPTWDRESAETSPPAAKPFNPFTAESSIKTEALDEDSVKPPSTEASPPESEPAKEEPEAPKRTATLARAQLTPMVPPSRDRAPLRTLEITEPSSSNGKKIVLGTLLLAGLAGAGGFAYSKLHASGAGVPVPASTRAMGSLVLDCHPDRVDVVIDKTIHKSLKKGESLDLVAGPHSADFSAKGFQKMTKKFTLKVGAPVKLEVHLTKGK